MATEITGPTKPATTPPPKRLRGKQSKALTRLLAGDCILDAAVKACVSPGALSDWMRHDETFIAEYQRRQTEIIDTAVRRIVANLEDAVDRVADIKESKDESVALRASESIIDRALQLVGRIPGGREKMAAAVGVNVNVSGAGAVVIDIDVSGERIASIQRIMRECNIIDVTPISVSVQGQGNGRNGNGNGTAGGGGALPPPPDAVHPAG